jgi:hypothetical protein
MENLINEVKITKIAAAAGAATTDVETSVIDMSGYDGVMIFCAIGTANAGNYIKAQQGTDATVTDAADLEGSKVVATGNGDVVTLDVFQPKERYIKGIVKRGASTTVGEIYALQYKMSKAPQNNGQVATRSGYIGKFLQSPAEGTA